MISYFSSTGNCKFAASKIAEATNDTAVPAASDVRLKASDVHPMGA